ncbi:MAG: glycosyltransferase family 2 protein [Candidatus Kerfeldbacteria bacterium]|nr:glycosyltransferase family 2 protein [Candidatus Kerfeldbacteria bacterium]
MNLDLSVIIVNYKEPGFLRQCLKGIRSANPRLTYEIIVIDNASNDGSVDMVREHFPDVQLLAQTVNRGFAVGVNLGLRASSGRYVLILNPDMAIFAGSLESLVAYLDAHSQVGMVAPKLLNPDGSVQMSCLLFPKLTTPILRRTPIGQLPFARRQLRAYLMVDWDHRAERPVEWVLGSCMLVRRSAVDHVGPMDERFFMYFEDVDWCRRFWEKHWRVVYLPSVQLVHYHQRMSAENPGLKGVFQKLTRIHIQSGFKYFQKYWRIPNPQLVA